MANQSADTTFLSWHVYPLWYTLWNILWHTLRYTHSGIPCRTRSGIVIYAAVYIVLSSDIHYDMHRILWYTLVYTLIHVL